jgi:hypothetical protein
MAATIQRGSNPRGKAPEPFLELVRGPAGFVLALLADAHQLAVKRHLLAGRPFGRFDVSMAINLAELAVDDR